MKWSDNMEKGNGCATLMLGLLILLVVLLVLFPLVFAPIFDVLDTVGGM